MLPIPQPNYNFFWGLSLASAHMRACAPPPKKNTKTKPLLAHLCSRPNLWTLLTSEILICQHWLGSGSYARPLRPSAATCVSRALPHPRFCLHCRDLLPPHGTCDLRVTRAPNSRALVIHISLHNQLCLSPFEVRAVFSLRTVKSQM